MKYHFSHKILYLKASHYIKSRFVKSRLYCISFESKLLWEKWILLFRRSKKVLQMSLKLKIQFYKFLAGRSERNLKLREYPGLINNSPGPKQMKDRIFSTKRQKIHFSGERKSSGWLKATQYAVLTHFSHYFLYPECAKMSIGFTCSTFEHIENYLWAKKTLGFSRESVIWFSIT